MRHPLIKLTLLIAASQIPISSAELSANFGVSSQYHFRGIQQTASASANGGVDYQKGDLSFGFWSADVNDGLEVDLYGSYTFNIQNDFKFNIGATSYQYTGGFDSAYNEINLSVIYSGLKLSYSNGKWDGIVGNEAATAANYTISTISYNIGGFSATYGRYGDDTSGDYVDLNYSQTMSEFDIAIGLLISGKELDNDESLYFTVIKSFNF